MAKIGDVTECYCCKCERMTTHEWIEDEVYEFSTGVGLLCYNCEISWEAVDPSTVDENTENPKEYS